MAAAFNVYAFECTRSGIEGSGSIPDIWATPVGQSYSSNQFLFHHLHLIQSTYLHLLLFFYELNSVGKQSLSFVQMIFNVGRINESKIPTIEVESIMSTYFIHLAIMMQTYTLNKKKSM